MAFSLTNFSWFNWGTKEKESLSNGSSLNSTSNDCDSVKLFPLFQKMPSSSSSSSKKVKRKWQSREQRKKRVDKEYDVVLVPSDGVGLSGSDSDDSDWSIGWLEPHAPDFYPSDDADDDEKNESFAVLVPCYRDRFNFRREVEDNNQLLSDIKNFPDEYSAEGKKFMEEWLSSLPNF